MMNSFFRKLLVCIVAGLVFSALLLLIGNGGTIAWFPPVVVFSLVAVLIALAIVFPFIWQFKESKQQINAEKVNGFFYSFIRYCIAFNLASFGWKKLMGLQFVVPPAIAGLPMNGQSGEWLTWYYFGHSTAFGSIIATIQIVGSCLLLFRRTMLLGAVILFPFMLNLTLINIFYKMNAGALLQSMIVTISILFLILLHYKSLVQFFLASKENISAINFKSNITLNLLRLSAIVLSFLFTLYLRATLK